MTLREFTTMARFAELLRQLFNEKDARFAEVLHLNGTVRTQIREQRFRICREISPKTAPAWVRVTMATRLKGELLKVRCYYRYIEQATVGFYDVSDCGESLSVVMRRDGSLGCVASVVLGNAIKVLPAEWLNFTSVGHPSLHIRCSPERLVESIRSTLAAVAVCAEVK